MILYLSALWKVINHLGQLSFFVYLWLIIMFVAWWKNNLTAQRLWIVTTYVGLTLLLFVVAMYYRLIVVAKHAALNGMTAAIATYVFVSFVGGMWSARAINKMACKQRGWIFLNATKTIRRFATFLECRIDFVEVLRNLADSLETKATTSDPFYHVQKTLETVKESE